LQRENPNMRYFPPLNFEREERDHNFHLEKQVEKQIWRRKSVISDHYALYAKSQGRRERNVRANPRTSDLIAMSIARRGQEVHVIRGP
jgi:hypothetical protein